MSSNRIQNTNELLKRAPLVDSLVVSIFRSMDSLDFHWDNNNIKSDSVEILSLLERLDYAHKVDNGEWYATKSGRSFLTKILINFDQLFDPTSSSKLRFIERLGSGRESVVLLAEHKLMNRQLAVKVYFEQGAEKRYQQLFKDAEWDSSSISGTFVLPVDLFLIEMSDRNGNFANLDCVVFPLHSGETLEVFLNSERPLTPFVVREFVSQIGIALSEIHKANIAHGDLHVNNIIVEDSGEGLLKFRVIDFTGCKPEDASSAMADDWEKFKLLVAYLTSKIPLSRMSVQRHIGARYYTLISALLDGSISDSNDFRHALKTQRYYLKYVQLRDEFIARKFKAGDSLALFRHEEISNPELARELFIPFEPFFQEFSVFGSALLHGHRGSGKSSYLAALAFLPKSKIEFCDPREKFGVLFACRQGEFKQLRVIDVKSRTNAYSELKHLLIIKIIRKTFEVLHETSNSDAWNFEESFDTLPTERFLKSVLPISVTANFEKRITERLESIHEALLRHEIAFTDHLISGELHLQATALLNEESLISFFRSIRASSGFFVNSQYFLLFDDAGVPNMPECMQRVLNELVRAANEVFCVKVTAERFSFAEEDSDDKVLETVHDFTPFNLAESLILRSGHRVNRTELKRYFAKLLAKRLSRYQSKDIEDYIGIGSRGTAQVVKALSKDERAVGAYSGWNIIWQVADRTPRHLLELISTIFKKAGVTEDSKPSIIDPKIQDEAVRNYSEMKLRHISYIPGKIEDSNTIALGQHLSNITLVFGRLCRIELERGPMPDKPSRYYEMLAIEIDREQRIKRAAEKILKYLIRYAIFDDTIVARTRDGGLRKPIYVLNRIYAPAFGISVRRDTHWRIRADRFERFLLDPTYELKNASKGNVDQNRELFDNDES